jgi:hypothetical protein
VPLRVNREQAQAFRPGAEGLTILAKGGRMKRKVIILTRIGAVMLAGASLFYCSAIRVAREKQIFINMNQEEIASVHSGQERAEVKKPDRGF